MAKVKDPLGCREASGSIGGMTFARGPFGAYVQAKGQPVGTVTVAQSLHRSVFQEVVRAYQDLTVEEILLWDEYGRMYGTELRVGSLHRLCGFGAFNRINTNRRRAGLPIVRRPPPRGRSDYFSKFAVRRTAMGIEGRPTVLPLRQQRFMWGRVPSPQPLSRMSRRFRWEQTRWRSSDDVWPEVMWGTEVMKPVSARYPWRYKCMDELGLLTDWIFGHTDVSYPAGG